MGGGRGPLVIPGVYTVRLSVDNVVTEQTVEVREDPRLEHDAVVRAEWTETLLGMWGTVAAAQRLSREIAEEVDRLDADENPLDISDALEDRLRDMQRSAQEVSSRLNRLYGSAQGWVGPLAADQEAQRVFLNDKLDELSARWNTLQGELPG